MIAEMERGSVVDVKNNGVVMITLESNPTGSDLRGRGVQVPMNLKNGQAELTDLAVAQGGVGFTLKFSVAGSDGQMLEVVSEPFNCGGQEAMLRIARQPVVDVAATTVPPIIHVTNSNGRTLPMANPEITVSVYQSPVAGSSLTDRSRATQRASMGSAEFRELYLSHAATAVEASVPAYMEQSVLYILKFSSPGFLDVFSEPFEAFPEVVLDTAPQSEVTLVASANCSGSVDGCIATLRDYLPFQTGSTTVKKKIQSVTLDVEVACTDLDAPGEVVRLVRVGGEELGPPLVSTGPWDGCAFAGCKDQCDVNMRKVISALDVKARLGSVDPRTGIYSSEGPPLSVEVALSDSVNICGCGAERAPLVVKATLRMQVSQDARAQGQPLWVQPKLSLRNADGTLYTLHSKTVLAQLAVNSAQAALSGASQLMSAAGVVAFTDLAITEGGPRFTLRFVALGFGAHNQSVYAESQLLAVGKGNFPVLSLSCVACDQPRTSKTAVYRALTRPPIVQLQNVVSGTAVQSSSGLRVDAIIGVNGPGGRLENEFRVASSGLVNFEGLTLLNGNCNDCVNLPLCGAGYTLIFLANDVAVESQQFDVPGGNRAPRWTPRTPPANAVIAVPIGTVAELELNATDQNMNNFRIRQVADPASGVLSGEVAPLQQRPWGVKEQILVPNNEVCKHPITAETLGWGIEAMTSFTPSCASAAPQFPGPPALVPVCFQARDDFEENSISVQTDGEVRCVHMHVLAPSAPAFLEPYYWDAEMAGLEGISVPMTVDRASLMPEQEEEEGMMRPPGLEMGAAIPMKYETGVGCTLRVPLRVEDHFAHPHDGERPMLQVLGHRTTATTVYGQEVLSSALPMGAVVETAARANPYVSALVWQPTRGQEGRVYTVCMQVETQYKGCQYRFYAAPYQGHRAQYCVEVAVERCKYCMVQGDSFVGLSMSYHSTYTQLWAGNSHVLRPAHVPTEVPLNLGPVYKAVQEDSLQSLAAKFAVTVKDLLDWNPDLPHDPDMVAGRAHLLTSQGLYEPGMAPWSWRNGTRAPDAQEVCFLPEVCLFEALPSAAGAAAAKQRSFDCGDCEDGHEYCTGRACIEGEGPPPWSNSTCTRFVGTRCQLCQACQAEELDYAGHVTVPGFFRSAGCDGEAGNDAVCAPCSVCGPGYVEERPCTPMQDRVCRKVLPSSSGTAFVPV